ncbi:lysophospholipid acyltransferase family protein [Planctomicrobium sp. SH527]|uniref:lysophospholipid acyltransferase family protein n=1 Tax=Planctomicrobium sp. SH527 TaxID=3448123 RepID=UPI003F5C8F6B
MKIRNKFLIRMLARGLSAGCRILYSTCRLEVVELAPHITPYGIPYGESYIYCNWHDGILNSLFCGRTVKMAALTSRHADGEYVAEVMEAIGITPIRGSNNHGGTTAAKQLMSAVSKHHITITTDGPRGPRRVVKPGVVFLASQTGQRIIPVGCSAKRAWLPKGRWTDLIVPKPFTTAYVVGEVPLAVPPNLTKEQLAPYVAELQRRMDSAQALADDLAQGRKSLKDVRQLEDSPISHSRAA